jgi:hypothetical protein
LEFLASGGVRMNAGNGKLPVPRVGADVAKPRESSPMAVFAVIRVVRGDLPFRLFMFVCAIPAQAPSSAPTDPDGLYIVYDIAILNSSWAVH